MIIKERGPVPGKANKKNSLRLRRTSAECGATLVELIVNLGVSAMVLAALTSVFFDSTLRSHNQKIIDEVQVAARTTLDEIAFEIRNIGSGMPLGQSSFTVTNSGLGDSPLGVLTESSATVLAFRTNEKGEIYVLSADFTPSSTSRSFTLLSSTGLQSNGTVYLSNLTVGGSSGLHGVIDSMSGTSLTINSDYVAPAGAAFQAGSLLEPVERIVYRSSDTWSGITRETSAGELTILPNSKLTLTYLDDEGSTLTPPLTATTIANSLQTIKIKIDVQSNAPLKDGTTYQTSYEQKVALRNLFLNR